MKVLLVFLLILYLSFASKVARSQATISLSLEYLGSCKDFSNDFANLYISTWANGDCLPITSNQRDRNDLLPSSNHFCVSITEKKSIINFVGLPSSFAVSFVPSHPFRSLLPGSQNYFRWPNCEVKTEYLTTINHVTSCTPNNVQLQSGYVVSDDRIYIFTNNQVSVCSKTGPAVCSYINTIANSGICPHTAPTSTLNVFFLTNEIPKDHDYGNQRNEYGETNLQDAYGNPKNVNGHHEEYKKKIEIPVAADVVPINLVQPTASNIVEPIKNQDKQLGKKIVEIVDESQQSSEDNQLEKKSLIKGHKKLGASFNKEKQSSTPKENSNPVSQTKPVVQAVQQALTVEQNFVKFEDVYDDDEPSPKQSSKKESSKKVDANKATNNEQKKESKEEANEEEKKESKEEEEDLDVDLSPLFPEDFKQQTQQQQSQTSQKSNEKPTDVAAAKEEEEDNEEPDDSIFNLANSQFERSPTKK